MANSNSSSADASGRLSIWLWLGLAAGVLGLAGSLYLSLEMGLKPCPLCYYQRAFVMSLVAVLALGLLTGAAAHIRLGVLGLPIAAAGFGVAGFHTYLEMAGKLECPDGVFGIGSAPQQSLAIFTLLFLLMLVDVSRGVGAGLGRWLSMVMALVVGGALAYASCTSNPPLTQPTQEYKEKVPTICRPPFTKS